MAFNYFADRDNWTTSEDVNERGLLVRTHTLSYRIESTTLVAPYLARTALPIGVFARFDQDSSARLKSVRTTMRSKHRNPWIYDCIIQFTTDTPDISQQNLLAENPLDDVPEIEVDGEPILVPMFKDLEDTAIVNKANQPITGVMQEKTIEVITINRNEPYRNIERDRLYRGSVNQFAYAGAEPGTLKLTRIRATRQYRNAILFWRYFYELKYNEDGWQPKILNAGTKQLIEREVEDPEDPEADPEVVAALVDCVDSDNMPVSNPVPLDEDGVQIPFDELPDAAVYLDFTTLRETDFAELSLL